MMLWTRRRQAWEDQSKANKTEKQLAKPLLNSKEASKSPKKTSTPLDKSIGPRLERFTNQKAPLKTSCRRRWAVSEKLSIWQSTLRKSNLRKNIEDQRKSDS